MDIVADGGAGTGEAAHQLIVGRHLADARPRYKDKGYEYNHTPIANLAYKQLLPAEMGQQQGH